MIEMIVSSYSRSFENLSFNLAVKVIIASFKRRKKREEWELYLMNYQKMNADNFESFESMYGKEDKIYTTQKKKRSTEELLKMNAEVIERVNKSKEV